MRHMIKVGSFAAAVMIFGCSKDEAKPAEGSAAKPTGAETAVAKAPALAWKKLDVLGGLQIEIPSDAEISDASADAPGVSVIANGCSLKVNQTTAMYTDDFDKAKAESEKDPGKKFKAWTKAEKTADGWVLHWTAEGMSGSTLQAIQVRKKIGDKQYECWNSTDNAAEADCILKACQGLKQ